MLEKNIYENEKHKPHARMLKEIIIIGCNVYESRQLASPAAALRTIFHPVSPAFITAPIFAVSVLALRCRCFSAAESAPPFLCNTTGYMYVLAR